MSGSNGGVFPFFALETSRLFAHTGRNLQGDFMRLIFGMFVLALGLVASSSAWAQLTIAHDPVPFAVRGQPLTLKAKVEGPAAPQSVTLYYALFRDAAPFRVAMKGSGLGYYVGAIEANLLSGVNSVSYYIEAQDKDGSISETPWYEVKFREPRPSDRPTPTVTAPPTPAPAGPAPVIPVPKGRASEESGWKTPVVVAGAAAVVLGGAYAISQSGGGGGGGGDDGNDGGNSATNVAGTYVGSVTRCTTPPGVAATCEAHAFSLLIDVRGNVFSETLHPGKQLVGQLDGNRFLLTTTLANGGTIAYDGRVANNSVAGKVLGSAVLPAGEEVYSGAFTADKE
ncbi:MAG: hypothetical protein M9963_11385 [Kiritimatiellae bacterium]|nr:hypothetical protein [Kiritimatiellia bacterium]